MLSAQQVIRGHRQNLPKFYAWAMLAFMVAMTFIGIPLAVWIWNKKAYPAYSGGFTRREVWEAQLEGTRL